MANTNHNSSRKPSGSSTHSAAHSNLNSPNVQPLRDLSASPRFLGVGTASTGARKSTNSGWQMWNNKPASRNASASSAASLPESAVLGQGSGYRSTREDTWNTPRSISASWNEVGNSPQRSDLPLDQQSYQQRQATTVSNTIDISSNLPNSGQYGSQRYGTLETGATSRFSSAATGRSGSYSNSQAFNVQQQLAQANSSGPTFPTLDSAVTEEDLSSAMRGMAVEDEYSFSQAGAVNRTAANNTHLINPSGHQQPLQVIPPAQQARPAFAPFPQPEYPAYYPNAYPYDAYRQTPDPNLYAVSPALSAATPASYHGASLHTDMRHGQQAALLYDFPGIARTHSQFYYTSPAMMYHPAHAQPAMPAAQGQTDMARDIQFGVQNLAFANVPPSPAQQQAFGMSPMDYTRQLSQMVSPALFGQAMGIPMGHNHPHGHRGKRGNFRHHHHEEANVQRSALLEEFRSDKSKTWELKNLIGHIVEFSRDQHGSRFIQTQLESANEEGRQLVYGEIVPAHTAQLIQDVFGNYVVQKLLEFGTPAERAQLVSAMEGNILTLSLHMYGCRVVQKAIELITPEQQSAFVNELDGNILKLVKDANGNHVIQKMIQAVAPERLPFVEAFRGHVHELATHPFGCRVLQRCLENMPQEYTRPLLDEMLDHVIDLMKDQFGNYVVQYVLEHGQPQDNKFIVSKLQGNMLFMAQHKFASNVCEKALVTSTPEMRSALIDEIITPKREGANVVMMMMRDQYANYVLQRALSVVEGDQKETLVNKIKPQLVQLRKQTSHFSKHLLAIDRLLEKCSPTDNANNAAATAPSASP